MDESKKMKSELGNRQWQNLARRWEGNMRDGCRPWRCWLESGVSNQEVLTPSSMWQEVPKVFWAGKSFIQSVGYRSGKMGLKSWGQGATEGDKVAMWSKSAPSAEGQDDNFKESIFYSVVKEKTKKENRCDETNRKESESISKNKRVVVSGHSTVACGKKGMDSWRCSRASLFLSRPLSVGSKKKRHNCHLHIPHRLKTEKSKSFTKWWILDEKQIKDHEDSDHLWLV